MADDGRVAVAGSVTGALEPGATVTSAVLSDSFVTVFDAEGEEMWTQRRGAKAADEATNSANQKRANTAGILDAAAQSGKAGASGTMLTGPQGIDPNLLNLGKTTLLGS